MIIYGNGRDYLYREKSRWIILFTSNFPSKISHLDNILCENQCASKWYISLHNKAGATATPAWELCCQLVRDILIATTFRVSQKLQVLFLVMTRVLFKNEQVKSWMKAMPLERICLWLVPRAAGGCWDFASLCLWWSGKSAYCAGQATVAPWSPGPGPSGRGR